MNRMLKSLFIAGALAGTLSACATYDYGYGYGYSQPYYRYAPSPYAYDYGYAYPYYGYSPGYYVGPSIGFDFRYHDHDRHDGRHWDRDRRGEWNGDGRRWSDRDRVPSTNWSGDRRAIANGNPGTRGTAAAAAVPAERRTVQQGAIPPMQAAHRDRAAASASRGTRIAPAPRDNQRAQITQPARQRPDVRAELRE